MRDRFRLIRILIAAQGLRNIGYGFYAEGVTSHSPGLRRFAATLGGGDVTLSGQVVGVVLSQGGREARQPCAVLWNPRLGLGAACLR